MSSYYFLQKRKGNVLSVSPHAGVLQLPPDPTASLLRPKQPVLPWSMLSPRGALSSSLWDHLSPPRLPQVHFLKLQFSSVPQSCPVNRSTPGFPVHHHLPESTQTHVH